MDSNLTDHHKDGEQLTGLPLELMIAFLALSLFGIAMNLFSIVLLTFNMKKNIMILPKTYAIYVICLAVGDIGLLFVVGIVKYTLISAFYDPYLHHYVYEKYMCRWLRLFMHGFHNSTSWILVCMTFERFMALCFPLKYQSFHNNTLFVERLVKVVFFLSFLLATPFMTAGPVYRDEHNTSVIVCCSLTSVMTSHHAFIINAIFHIVISITLPYGLLVFFTVSILIALNVKRNQTSKSLSRKSRRISIMMLFVCLSYILLWAPQLSSLVDHSDAHANRCDAHDSEEPWQVLCALSNSVWNFFLYCFTMKKFRIAVLSVFTNRVRINDVSSTVS